MPTTTIHIRMDEKLKEDFELVVSDLGFNMTTVFNAFARSVVRNDRLPAEMTTRKIDPFYSEKNMIALRESIEQIHRGQVHTFADVEELKKFAKEKIANAN